MNRWLSLLVLAVLGASCGFAVGLFNTGFVPSCGDPCGMQRLGSSLLWATGCLIAFPLIGTIAFKATGKGPRQTAGVALALTLATLLPSATIYGYELHKRYWQGPARLGVPNVDFSEMAIATRPVEATDSGGTSKIRVNAWERCALGYATCDKPRQRTVEAVCLGKGTTVLIDEKDWPAFRRIQEEDLQGVEGLPKNMDLCAFSAR